MPERLTGEGSTKSVGLPPVIFLYTIDQIATMLGIEESSVRVKYLYYIGRSTGTKQRHHMEAINIAADPTDRPDWRVTMKEFIRWLKRMGFKISDMSYPG